MEAGVNDGIIPCGGRVRNVLVIGRESNEKGMSPRRLPKRRRKPTFRPETVGGRTPKVPILSGMSQMPLQQRCADRNCCVAWSNLRLIWT